MMKVLQKIERRHDFIGQRIMKHFGGEMYSGTITKKVVEQVLCEENKGGRVWKIDYDDGDSEEWEYTEVIDGILLRRDTIQTANSRCGGRKMQALELFAGESLLATICLYNALFIVYNLLWS